MVPNAQFKIYLGHLYATVKAKISMLRQAFATHVGRGVIVWPNMLLLGPLWVPRSGWRILLHSCGLV